MKTFKKLLIFFTVIIIMSFSFSCIQRAKQPVKAPSIVEPEKENTVMETTTETVTTTETETVVETSTETAITTLPPDTNLTQEEAINIAMSVAKGDVDRIETEIEDGKLVWKIRIISDGTRTDVRIEDATGKVIRVDKDDD